MKRNIVMALLIVISVLVPVSTAMASTAKSGGPCAQAGQKVTVYDKKVPNRGKTFTCVKSKNGLKFGPAVTAVKIKSLLAISQVWKGNSVSLSLLDSQGKSCDSATKSSECTGFYIGWRASFNDSDRTVTYGQIDTVISGLKVGDQGAFQLMYQESQNATPIVVKEFPFSYNY